MINSGKPKFYIFAILPLFVGGVFFLFHPSSVFACHRTALVFPQEGQNFVVSLPFFFTPSYDTALQSGFYYVDLYKGTPGNAVLIAGHSQGGPACSDNRTAGNVDGISEAGDYFYVLYDARYVSLSLWRNQWVSGIEYPFLVPDYAVSRFSAQSKRIPVIIIPGIGASWNFDVMLHDKLSDEWGFFGGVKNYEGLIKALESVGYQKDNDLFVAFYDWRKSNNIKEDINGNSVDSYLIPLIDRAKSLCQCPKVAIAAHSMGGILARSYIQSNEYFARNDVSHLFLIGVPSRGSSDVYTLWEGGHIPENWEGGQKIGIAFYSWFLSENKLAATIERERERYFTIRKSVPSVKELLPVYDFLNFEGVLKTFFGTIERNEFLFVLSQNIHLLSSRTKLYTVVGKDQPTVNNIPIIARALGDEPLWIDGKPNPLDPVASDVNGDNRVLISSSKVAGTILESIVSAGHGELVDKAESIIASALGFNLQGDFPSLHYANVLAYAVASPADIEIIDPQGNILNKEINSIPNGEYMAEDDPVGVKIVVIGNPLPGNYQVKLKGVANGGEYHVLAGNFASGAGDSTAAVKGIIQPDQTVEYKSEYNPGNEQPVTLVLPDMAPPIINVISPEARDYLRSEKIPGNISIIDEGSGVASQDILLDGIIIKNGDVVDPFFLKLGDHLLTIEAKDFSGNKASSPVSFRIVASLESSIADIERAFELGWINSKGIKNSLIKKLQQIVRLEKKIEFLEEKLPDKPKIIRRIEKIEKRIDKILGKALLKELEAQRGKHINESAFQILSEDINWLLNK